MEKERIELFKTRFNKYYPMLCDIAYGYIADKDDCEDIVQELFVGVWKRSKDELPEEEFLSYVTASVRNNCISILRKRKNVKILSMEDSPTEFANLENEDEKDDSYSEMLYEMLSKLPPKCKDVFMMSRFKNMKYREIAKELNISEKTVENHMGKAIKLLRSYCVSLPALIILIFVSSYILKNL